MSKNDIWYGYLEAGAQSSPVVRDMALETKSRKTVYLYNHARGRFLEYSLEIVEPKLRELKDGEVSIKELDGAFKTARKAFASGKATKKWSDDAPPVSAADNEEPDLPPDMDTSMDYMEEEDA